MDKLLNPNTGDYYADDQTTNTLQNAVYISLINHLGSYWADKTLGSLLHTIVREKDLPRVGLLAVQYATEALDHIIKDGRAKTINITADQPHNGTLLLHIEVTDNRGDLSTFKHLVKVV